MDIITLFCESEGLRLWKDVKVRRCNMRQIIKIWIAMVLIVGLSILSLSALAESFQYDFDDDLKEDDWELWGNNSIWQVKDGFLRTTIQAPDFFPTIGLFQFKGIPGNYEPYEFFADNRIRQRQINNPGYETFTIIVQNIGVKPWNFGIALGRRFPDLRGSHPFFYLFLTHISYSSRFNGWGGVAFGKATGRVPLNPDTIWETNELTSMELRFNKGHIQWFADGEKRADFEDPEFSTTEILGFVTIGDRRGAEQAWVDSFKISGPGLSVSSQAKLATTWGQLKQRQ